MDKTLKVHFADDDHVWIEGRQFISLKRFAESRKEASDEMIRLDNKVKELTEKLNAVNVLIKVDESEKETTVGIGARAPKRPPIRPPKK